MRYVSGWMELSRVSGVATCRGAAMLGSFGGVQASPGKDKDCSAVEKDG